MGTNVVLGRASDCELVLSDSTDWPDLSLFIRGDFVVGDATLNRFFSLHVIAVPLVLIGLVVAHIDCPARSWLE